MEQVAYWCLHEGNIVWNDVVEISTCIWEVKVGKEY